MERPINPRHAVYAGSFDPVTLGHLDIIARGAVVFEQLTVGIGINPDKQPLFTAHERQSLLERVIAARGLKNVAIATFSELTVDFARNCGAGVMLRGMRTVSDMEAEFSMALANEALAPEVETVFMMASDRFSHVSSTLIRQIAQMGSSQSTSKLKQFVPEEVLEPLMRKFLA